jgi:dTDP-4-dehydrorhamnose 3,5-epimerase
MEISIDKVEEHRRAVGVYIHLADLLEKFGVSVKQPARIHCDDRGRRLGDVFGIVSGDINITYIAPGAATNWHYHKKQYDEWIVLKGHILVRLAKPNGDGTYTFGRIALGEEDRKLIHIPPGVLHGYENPYPQEALLMYHISQKYDPNNPDEYRLDNSDVKDKDGNTLPYGIIFR